MHKLGNTQTHPLLRMLLPIVAFVVAVLSGCHTTWSLSADETAIAKGVELPPPLSVAASMAVPPGHRIAYPAQRPSSPVGNVVRSGETTGGTVAAVVGADSGTASQAASPSPGREEGPSPPDLPDAHKPGLSLLVLPDAHKLVPPQPQAFPIHLPMALQLAGVRPLDIALATQRWQAAQAEWERARVLWLPTVFVGAEYFRHDGRIQDVAGHLFDTSKQSLMLGAAPGMVFALSDALYAPLAARQVAAALWQDMQTARNNAVLAVTEAYFAVQQARGEVLGLVDVLQRTEELVDRVDKMATAGLVPKLERNRVQVELSRRRQSLETAYERWQTASAELNRLLRLDPATVLVPLEPPHWRVELVELDRDVQELVALALQSRPELASQWAFVQAALARIRQERWRPLLPSILVRGSPANPGGTLAAGYFGGGLNGQLASFGWRNAIDVQLLWEFQNLGLGNHALVRQRQAEHEQAVIRFTQQLDLVTAEVTQAHAQAQRALRRSELAETELKLALATVQTSLEGMQQTRLIGGVSVLVIRPQEVVAALQQLEQAYRNYYGAVADSNRAQFRLYRALGQPAQLLTDRSPQAPGELPPSPG